MPSARKTDGRRRHDRPPGIARFWTRSFVGIALVLLLAAALLAGLWTLRLERDGQRQLAGSARILAASVSAELARVRERLEPLARDPALRAALLAPAPDRLAAQEQALLARLPGAVGVHLFAAQRIDSADGIAFMSFAGLDLAREAIQDRRLTHIEVHKVGQADMHLAIAAPVLDETGERALGVAHVALPMSLLPDTAGMLGNRGTLSYQQIVDDTAATLGPGAATLAQTPDRTEPIAGTRLRVAAWLARSGYADPWLFGGLALAYAMVLVAIGAILRLGHSALRRDLLLDLKGLTASLDAAARREPLPRRARARLNETRALHRALDRLLVQAARADSAAPPAPAAPVAPPPEPPPGVELKELELPPGLELYGGPLQPSPQAPVPLAELPAEIFGTGEIRARADAELSAEEMYAIGQALGSEAAARGDRTATVGRDGRAASQPLAEALQAGLRATGLEVADVGAVPTPLVLFACRYPQPGAGARVTTGRGAPDENGLKAAIGGVAADAQILQRLRARILNGQVAHGQGDYRTADAASPYCDYVAHTVALVRSLKIVVDAGNGTAGAVAPALYRALGCETIELSCNPPADLQTPPLDPARPDCLRALGERVQAEGADLGFAFDEDGERLGVVDSQGQHVAADRVLMLLAVDVLSRYPGSDAIFDVKCSRYLAEEIRRAGGRPVMVGCGQAALKARARESGAPIAGELSGKIVFNERWFGFADALYAGARLLEVLSMDPRDSHAVFAALPGGATGPEQVLTLPAGEPERLMRALLPLAERLDGAEIIRIDGLRVELEQGWGLAHASNAPPHLAFRFEGDDPESQERIRTLFRHLMEKAAPGLSLPF